MNRKYKMIASLVLTVVLMASVMPMTALAKEDYFAPPSWSSSSGTDYIQVRLYDPKVDNDFRGRFDQYCVELTGNGYSKLYFAYANEYVTFNGLRTGTEYQVKVTAYYVDLGDNNKDVLKTDYEYVYTKGGSYDYYTYGNRTVISQPSPFTMGNAVFVLNGNYDRLNSVTLNGSTLRQGTDYTYEYVDGGRLRVTILSTALTWLTNGYHSVLFTLADGYTASTSFQVNRGGSTTTTSSSPSLALNYTVTASSLRVREWANVSARQISSLVRGTAVSVQEVSNGWGRITLYDGRTGWVSMQHLLPYGSSSYTGYTGSSTVVVTEPATTSSTTTANGMYYTTIALRMRSGSTSSSDILGILPAGTAVYVTYIDGSWAHCTVNGQTVYVDVSYLRR